MLSLRETIVDPTTLEYLGSRLASRQWTGFLGALAREFSDQLPEADLRALMHRVGARFASESALADCQSLDDVQFAMSKIWMAQDWGWVTVHEHDDSLHISHHCSPLSAAFGQQASPWMAAFLEGAYQRWFEQLGAGKSLSVKQAGEPDAVGCVEFRLGR
ncbi:hypothetical protein GCM10009097_44050 [Pigmentiphaga daeguensis]|uniref:Cellulose synthase subunit D n=1 Tax=Pigmentiphaga daeguensis TaxID=414049 RepID=A0ABN1CLW1_9BURK